jgi:hypothetical protein
MKALKTAAMVVGAIALVATGIGAAAGAGLLGAAATFNAAAGVGLIGAMGTIGTIASIASVGLGVIASLAQPKFQQEGSPLSMEADTNSGLPIWIGRTGFAGRQIARVTANSGGWNKKDLLFFALLLSCTSLANIERFTADNVALTFDGSGHATTSGYVGWMTQAIALGDSPQSAALSATLNGVGFPGWTGAHKLSGMAHLHWDLRFDSDSKHYENGVPKPMWVGTADAVYDPRLDSTYPGGSGSNRFDDETSWTGSPSNPGLYALFWARGHFQNGIKVCGIGAPKACIRVSDFVEMANVCEANGWRVGGVEWTTSAKWDIFSRILQAGGAVPTQAGAMIGCRVSAPRVSAVTIPSNHWLDDIEFAPTKGRRERFNAVLPRFVSESHGWDVITGAEISVDEFATADRGKRTKGIDFPLVQAEDGVSGYDGNQQVGELAMYAICNSREGDVPFAAGLQYIGISSGTCVTLQGASEGFDDIKVVIMGRTVDLANATIHFSAETETDSKHPFALGESTTPPEPPSLTPPPDPVNVPDLSDWSVTPINLADGQAGLRVVGTLADPVADALVVEYSVAGDAVWRRAGTLTGSGTLSLDIGPLNSLSDWDVRLAYSAKGRAGDWLEISSVTTLANELLGSSLGGLLTNENHTLPATSAGVTLSYAGAEGDFEIRSGNADVSSDFALSTFANPQGLSVTYTGQHYEVTGGFDSGEDNATLTILATGSGAFTGVEIKKVFSLAKSKTGTAGAPGSPGSAGADAKLLTIAADRRTIVYDGTGAASPSTQTTTFTANKRNTSATVTWSVTDAAGVPMTPTSTYLSAATGDTVTMSESQFAAARNGTTGVIVSATLTDGVTLLDKMSVSRVKDGAVGTAGAPGAPGANGATTYTWVAYSDAPDGSVNFTNGTPDGRGYQGLAFNKTTATESTTASDYTWEPYRGPATFGLVAHANVVVGSDYIVHLGGGTWDGSAYSSEAYVGGAFASIIAPNPAVGGVMFGLNTDPTTDASYSSIDYAIYATNTGDLYAYENGSGTSLGATYAAGEALTVHYDGANVRYYKNGAVLLTRTGVASGLRFYFDTSFAGAGSRIDGIKFGPAGAVGGPGATGSPGSPGSPGVDALTVSPPPSLTIPCTANGTPKGSMPGFDLTVFQGATNRTTAASYNIDSQTGVSGMTHAGNGVFTGPTGFSADTGEVQITVSYGGISSMVVGTYSKAKDGANYVYELETTVTTPTATTYASSAVISLLMGPSGNINVDVNGSFDILSGSQNVLGYVEYNLGSGWNTLTGSSFTGNAANNGNGHHGDFALFDGVTGASISLSTKQTVQFRLMLALNSSSPAIFSWSASMAVEWEP